MSSNDNTLASIGVILVALVLFGLVLAFAPLLYIWVLNTLFPVLAIPYALNTWFAMLVAKLFLLGGLSQARAQFKNK